MREEREKEEMREKKKKTEENRWGEMRQGRTDSEGKYKENK